MLAMWCAQNELGDVHAVPYWVESSDVPSGSAELVQRLHEVAVHRSGALGDEEEHMVALALCVGVVVLGGGGDPPAASAAVERPLGGEGGRAPLFIERGKEVFRGVLPERKLC